MGNICNSEESQRTSHRPHSNTYYQSVIKTAQISQTLSQDNQQHRMYEIGVFLDKSESGSQEQCIQKWQDLFEKQERGNLTTNQQDDLQKALYYAHKKKPKQFEAILENIGGGKIRWYVWKTLLKSQIKNKHPAMKIWDTGRQSTIQRDVTRTFQDQPYFQLEKQSQEQLSQLLNLIGNTYVELGYTQGMNFVIAFILLQCGGDVEEAWTASFTLFYSSKWMLYGIYMSEFPLMQLLCLLTKKLLQKRFSDLYKHYTKLQIDDAYLLQKWILTFYLYNLPTQVCLHIWDIIISRGIFAIASINVELLGQIQSNIMACKNSLEFLDMVQNLHPLQLFDNYKEMKQAACQNMPNNKEILTCLNELKKIQQFKNAECKIFFDILEKIQDQETFKLKYEEWLNGKIKQVSQLQQQQQQ